MLNQAEGNDDQNNNGLQQFGKQFGLNFGHGPSQPQSRIEHGLGSGVIISPDGYIVTNNHVIDGAVDIRVTMTDRRILPPSSSAPTRLPILRSSRSTAPTCPMCRLGDSTKLHPGETVLAFGNPLGIPLHGDARHHQRAEPPQSLRRQPPRARRIHPDRRGHQPWQLRRAAGECARRSHRHQHLPGLRDRRFFRHGIRHSRPDRGADGRHSH